MKKYLLLFAALLTAACYAKAQKADTASQLVHYKFSHLRDTTQPEPLTENMMLLIGKTATVYKSYDRKLGDIAMKKQIQEQMNNGTGQVRINRKNAGSGAEYYLFPTDNKMVRKENLINNYLIDEPMPVIDWKITTDTASFSGLKCQKATTHFKGRDYTAWFCPNIPVHAGPWKLSGLPGLILEAYDTKKQVVFKFDGIEDMSKLVNLTASVKQQTPPGGPGIIMFGGGEDNSDPRVIQVPADGIKVSDQEFIKLREAMRKDPDAFMQSAMAARGVNFNNGNGPHPVMKIAMGKNTENNPIELPETK